MMLAALGSPSGLADKEAYSSTIRIELWGFDHPPVTPDIELALGSRFL